MKSILSFSNFVGAKKRPYLEAAGDKYRGIHMPIPPMVISVMRNVPAAAEVNGQVVNKRSVYANTLKWIFTQGLYEASRKRAMLTKLANETFAKQLNGNKLFDHEMYSKQAHDWWGERGVDLAGFYRQTYGAHPEEYEPTKMDLGAPGYGNDISIAMQQINQSLASEKLPQFRYGGYEGLIEYIETGQDPQTGRVWAKRQTPKSRLPREHDDRIGLNVAGARTSRATEYGDSEIVFKFDNFSAPNNERAWGRTVYNILQYGNQQVEKALAGQEADLSDVADKSLYDRIKVDPRVVQKAPYRGIEDTVGGRYDYHTNFENGLKDYASEEFGDPEMFHVVAFLISLGVDEFADDYNKANRIKQDSTKNSYPIDFANDEELKSRVLDKVFRGGLTISPLFRNKYQDAAGGKPKDSKRYTRALIDAGVERAKRMSPEQLDGELQKFLSGNSRMTRVAGLNPETMPGFDKEYIRNDLDRALKHEPSPNIDVYSTAPGDYGSYAKNVKNRQAEDLEELTPDALAALQRDGYSLPKFAGQADKNGLPLSRSVANISLSDPHKRGKVQLKRVKGQWYIVRRRDQQLATPESIEDYKKAGYEMQPFDGPKDDNGLPLNQDTYVMYKPDDRRDKRYLKKDSDGYWFFVNPIEGEVPEEELSDVQKGSLRPAVFSGHKMGLNRSPEDRDYFPVGHKATAKIIQNMEDDPEGYGLSATDPNNTLEAFYRQVVAAARRSFESRGGKSADIDNRHDMYSYVPGSFLDIAGKNDFRIGDLDSQRLPQYLTHAGVEDPAKVKEIIDTVKGYTQEGLNAEQIRQKLPPEIFAAFAKNGRSWRMKKAIQHVLDRVSDVASQGRGSDPDAVPGEETGGSFTVDKEVQGDFSYKPDYTGDDNEEEEFPHYGNVDTITNDPIDAAAEEDAKRRPLRNKYGDWKDKTPDEQRAFASAYENTATKLRPLVKHASSLHATKNVLETLNSVPPTAELSPDALGVVCAVGDFARSMAVFFKAENDKGNKTSSVGIGHIISALQGYTGKFLTPDDIAPIKQMIDAGKQAGSNPQSPQSGESIEKKVAKGAYTDDAFEDMYKYLLGSSDPEDQQIADRVWGLIQSKPSYLKIATAYRNQHLRPTADAPRQFTGLGGKALGRRSPEAATLATPTPAPAPATPKPTLAPTPPPPPVPAPVAAAPAAEAPKRRSAFDKYVNKPWGGPHVEESVMPSFGTFRLRKLRQTILEHNCNRT